MTVHLLRQIFRRVGCKRKESFMQATALACLNSEAHYTLMYGCASVGGRVRLG